MQNKNNEKYSKVQGNKPVYGRRRKTARSDPPRRKTPAKDERELYSLPKSTIKEFIKNERRHDELDRLREVRNQKRIWIKTVIFCALLNLGFLTLGVIGLYVR